MLIDEGAHQQVPLAVDDHHQVEQTEQSGGSPSRQAATPHDEGIGQEDDHPEEVAQVENLRDEETLDGSILADRCQQVGFDEHQRCLLGGKTSTEVYNQQEEHDDENHLRNILCGGNPSEEGAKGEKLDGQEAYDDISEELAPLVGFEHGVTLLAELGVLAEKPEKL